MLSKIEHHNGIITEFEWCFGNYKDWFVQDTLKHKRTQGKILFSNVSAYMTYETNYSKIEGRSEPMMKIYFGPSYKNLKGLRIKVSSPGPIEIKELKVIRTDIQDTSWEDGYDTSHIDIKAKKEIEIFGNIRKRIYNFGREITVYHIQNFQVLKKD